MVRLCTNLLDTNFSITTVYLYYLLSVSTCSIETPHHLSRFRTTSQYHCANHGCFVFLDVDQHHAVSVLAEPVLFYIGFHNFFYEIAQRQDSTARLWNNITVFCPIEICGNFYKDILVLFYKNIFSNNNNIVFSHNINNIKLVIRYRE